MTFSGLVSLMLAVQGVSQAPWMVFDEACLSTVGDRAALVQYAEAIGAVPDGRAAPMFEDAETVTVFGFGAVTVRLETFAAVSEWVEAPPFGDDLQTLLRTGRDPRRRPLPQMLREEPATAVCMLNFDQGEADLMSALQGVTVEGRPLRDYASDMDFQTYRWRVDSPRLIHIEYGRADRQRDAPGTRSVLSAGFRLP